MNKDKIDPNTENQFGGGGTQRLEEVDHNDGYGEYFTPVATDGGGKIQYAYSLERKGVSYLAPDALQSVRYYEAFPIRGLKFVGIIVPLTHWHLNMVTEALLGL